MRNTIADGDTVLLRLPSAEIKSVKANKLNTTSLGKFGSFASLELLGKPYGNTYEIVEKTLRLLEPIGFQNLEDTNATNQLITDTEDTQLMSYEEVEALKESGLHSSEIIQRQISQHSKFDLKTEYSKDKYKKRKEAKFSKTFTIIEPTLHNVCDYWYHKDPGRVRDMRPDTLAQALALANIMPGAKYLVVDDASGLLVAAVLDRLGGQGRLFAICDVESQPVYHITEYMNFDREMVDPVLVNLNWATADEDHAPVASTSWEENVSERQKIRQSKRKTANEVLTEQRNELFYGDFSGLIVSSQYDSFSIADKLYPFLRGSASIVIHGPHIQSLAEVQQQMRADDRFLSPTITEPWLRRYQVLPGRMHPEMTSAGAGGYLLHTIKVFTQPLEYEKMVQKRIGLNHANQQSGLDFTNGMTED